ncbi:hypothetical protein V9T40_002013 [Parthenolecanium corni]|uniref:MULE transposase domain-containing protein n=1 Tax=Parthenolecanium corni TaxID=536013 RepID=A0AAN9Y4Y2_9HEMI
MNYEFLWSEKNKKLLVVDGYKSGFQKKLSNEVERWICVNRKCTYRYIPLEYFLLPDKQSSSYKVALHSLQSYVTPTTVYADFEKAIHIAVSQVWPQTNVRGCRFHLGQSWWRKIQSAGLSAIYHDAESEDGKLLKFVFGLPLLSPDEVDDCFVEDIMARKPVGRNFDVFFDYLLETYIASDATFPPIMWAECTASAQRTTNCCEAFHSKLNALFNSPHPNIFFLIQTLIEIQTETYVKMRSSATSRINSAKFSFINDHITKYKTNLISREQYVCQVCYKFLPQI